MIEALFVLRGKCGDLLEVAVSEFDAAVGELADGRVVRDHQDCVAFGVKLTKVSMTICSLASSRLPVGSSARISFG